jgi:transposase
MRRGEGWRGAGGCKGDYAASVRWILPSVPGDSRGAGAYSPVLSAEISRRWNFSLDITPDVDINILTRRGGLVMTRRKSDPKTDALREQGCLHPHPEKVTDELFAAGEFFDARDLVQVKYEMLRRVRVDGRPVSDSAARFGLSRPSYYQAQGAFKEGGLPALLPKKPGPRRAHKLSPEVVEALREALAEDPELVPEDLVRLVQKRFGVSVHRRSVERALARPEKKRR